MAKRKGPGPVLAEPEKAPAYERAHCEVCDASVTYEPTGAGFTIVTTGGVELDATFGVGAHGRPICPHGHGEMDPMDTDPEQAALFDTAKAFNFEGAYLEVESLTVEVDRLATIAEDDKGTAKNSATLWAEAAKRLHTLTLELRRRRLAKRDVGRVDDSDETLVARLGVLGLTIDVATMRTIQDGRRVALLDWLAEAEAHPENRTEWLAWRPASIAEAAVGAPVRS